jgi:bacterioferritin
MSKQKSIDALQFFVTHLAEGAMVHRQQGMVFKSQGFTKLGQKYLDHFSEEMGWVEKFTERMLDLGAELKFEGMKSRDLICDPIEYVKADLAIQEPGVELLMKCMEGVKDDPTTYDLLKDYLKDEEEDLYWSQEALEIIEKIGVQNWLMKQM